MAERLRVAALIEDRAGRVLMVRQRARGVEGRHDGREYWTLPGGGIEPGEDPAEALRREVAEEVGLHVIDAAEIGQFPYPSGITTVFRVQVAAGEPRLGVDDLPCPCPRMVGLDWIESQAEPGDSSVPLLVLVRQPSVRLTGP